MTTDITELAQSHELLIANGNETANLLRHLADNEIDSDYFAVVSECESYGKETDAELSITEFALRAAGYVDALVEALEKVQQRIAYQREYYEGVIADGGKRIAELESRSVKLPSELELRNNEVCSVCAGNALQVIEDKLAAADIKWEAE
ncbi:ead/Ea22-like family protein [Klebsiella michiganensis]|uniref:ead/Ea22-like family protein n=1 Tax=Klebsiella michiganensis TaxID=1134687 RepID=UPI001F462C30|nr:ead/Ea22-like family protein [Klebsiella michiganensis]